MVFVWKSRVDDKFAMAIRRNSPYYQGLNSVLKKMQESGQLRLLKEKYFMHSKTCKTSGVKSIGYDKLGSIFIVVLSANVVALVLLGFENLIFKCVNKEGNNYVSTQNLNTTNVDSPIL